MPGTMRSTLSCACWLGVLVLLAPHCLGLSHGDKEPTAWPRRALHASTGASQAAGAAGTPAGLIVGVLAAMAIMTAMVAMCGLCGGDSNDGAVVKAPKAGQPVPAALLLKWDDIKTDATIGQGGFGTVYKGMWQGNRVAVKMLNAGTVTEDMRQNLKQEAVTMSSLMHPAIARVFGLVDEGSNLALVMQYYRGGTVEDFMKNRDTAMQYQEFDVLKRLLLASRVAKGMQFLHEKQIVHGDLKTSNILLDDSHRTYITDFGLARILKKSGNAVAKPAGSVDSHMSVQISPPEVLKNASAPRKTSADVYAFAIVLLEMVSGQPTFKGMNPAMITAVITNGQRPMIPHSVPANVKQLIEECWAENPESRPAFASIVKRLDDIVAELQSEAGVSASDATILM